MALRSVTQSHRRHFCGLIHGCCWELLGESVPPVRCWVPSTLQNLAMGAKREEGSMGKPSGNATCHRGGSRVGDGEVALQGIPSFSRKDNGSQGDVVT